MLRVLAHIQEHLNEELVLEDLAKRACLSPHHFHRVFRGMLGEPLAAHVRRLRSSGRPAVCGRPAGP